MPRNAPWQLHNIVTSLTQTRILLGASVAEERLGIEYQLS